jgi:hypothetical protein
MNSGEIGQHMEKVACALLGNPTKRTAKELRYRTRGSLEIDLAKGTFSDHETGEGGGVLDLIKREKKCDNKSAIAYMRAIGCEVGGRNIKQRKIVASYDYVDEHGNHLFQVVRFEPKDFRQRLRDTTAKDGWSWSVKGVRQVPYRLPELQEALAHDRPVFIVEGEKDAENLAKWNVPATCNAGGAGKWRDELNEYFRRADVVILPDNDPQTKNPDGSLLCHPDGRPVFPGQDHAKTIAANLAGVARSVRVLELPGLPLKGDVSDWIAAGGTVEEFWRRVEAEAKPASEYRGPPGKESQKPPRFKVTPFSAIKLDPTRINYLVKRLFPRTGLVVIWGPPKCGKSFWALDLAMHVALGWPYRGRRTRQGAVVYLALEGAEGFKARTEAIRNHYRVSDAPFYLMTVRIDLVRDHAQLVADIRKQLGAVTPAAVFIDTLNRSLIGSEAKDEDMSAFLRAADAIRDAFDCVVAIVHHCGINDSRPRGHTSLTGAADVQLAVRRDGDRNFTVTVEYMKDGPEGDVLTCRLDTVEVGADADGDRITSCENWVWLPSAAHGEQKNGDRND